MLRMNEVELRYHESRHHIKPGLAVNRITEVEAVHKPTCRAVTVRATKKCRSVPLLEALALQKLTKAVYG